MQVSPALLVYYVDLKSDSDGDAEKDNAADQLLKHAVLKTTVTERPEPTLKLKVRLHLLQKP